MLRAVIPAFALVLVTSAVGCGKMEVRAQLGQGCTTSPDDDPQYICTPQYDLVCIATYSQVITKERVAARFDGGARDVYICLRPCSPDAAQTECATDEVCCT